MILKWFFAQVCALQWTKVKRYFGRVFYHFTIFWFKNAKVNFLKKISVLSAVFIEFKYRWLQNCLVDLKIHQTLVVLLMIFFMNLKKMIFFQIFQNVGKSSAAHTKIIVCVLLYVNMFDKTPCNLMSTFSNDIFVTNLVSTSDFNVKL